MNTWLKWGFGPNGPNAGGPQSASSLDTLSDASWPDFPTLGIGTENLVRTAFRVVTGDVRSDWFSRKRMLLAILFGQVQSALNGRQVVPCRP